MSAHDEATMQASEILAFIVNHKRIVGYKNSQRGQLFLALLTALELIRLPYSEQRVATLKPAPRRLSQH